MLDRVLTSHAPRVTVIIRLLVGLVVLSEGIQKFPFPEVLGVGRLFYCTTHQPAMSGQILVLPPTTR